MDDERIRRRAHEIWEREGCPEGRQDAHWEQARRELEAEEEAAAPAALDAAAAQPPAPGPVVRGTPKTVRGRKRAPGSGEESGGAA
ncbi:DUF2934 domain-containing protein [Azospirillum sp.]|uniref:DUF2934 domain-containing protein n=1 Tax=Azospirillum sp. TaxID=34012 RepID=UPI002D6AA19A|nr:DUF2934 domain-containing protein [Azospirillum sp.]HYD68872.1 DUF2934 domain-containing protein [Azospirillum sp.]